MTTPQTTPLRGWIGALPPVLTLDLLDRLVLAEGCHERLSEGACLLEATAWLAGEVQDGEPTDRPECASRTLAAFGRNLNDVLPDEKRQRLVPFAARLVGTAGKPELDERAAYLALDWLVRVYTPTWLRLVPALAADADLLASAHEVRDLHTAAAIGDTVREAASRASAAWDAARAAAGAAAGAAAWAAAWAAARDATWDTAGNAAWAAARAAAWNAAGDTAGAALRPAVDVLQDSAIALFNRMLALYEEQS